MAMTSKTTKKAVADGDDNPEKFKAHELLFISGAFYDATIHVGLPPTDPNSTVSVSSTSEYSVFKVHKAIISNNSTYFRKIFQSTATFKETIESKLSLPSHDPKTLHYILKWLYTGTWQQTPDIEQTAKIIVDADYFEIASLKHTAIEQFREEMKDDVYRKNGTREDEFVEAVKQLFRMYTGSASGIDGILEDIIGEGYLEELMAQKDIEQCFKADTDLMWDLMKIMQKQLKGEENQAKGSPSEKISMLQALNDYRSRPKRMGPLTRGMREAYLGGLDRSPPGDRRPKPLDNPSVAQRLRLARGMSGVNLASRSLARGPTRDRFPKVLNYRSDMGENESHDGDDDGDEEGDELHRELESIKPVKKARRGIISSLTDRIVPRQHGFNKDKNDDMEIEEVPYGLRNFRSSKKRKGD